MLSRRTNNRPASPISIIRSLRVTNSLRAPRFRMSITNLSRHTTTQIAPNISRLLTLTMNPRPRHITISSRPRQNSIQVPIKTSRYRLSNSANIRRIQSLIYKRHSLATLLTRSVRRIQTVRFPAPKTAMRSGNTRRVKSLQSHTKYTLPNKPNHNRQQRKCNLQKVQLATQANHYHRNSRSQLNLQTKVRQSIHRQNADNNSTIQSPYNNHLQPQSRHEHYMPNRKVHTKASITPKTRIQFPTTANPVPKSPRHHTREPLNNPLHQLHTQQRRTQRHTTRQS